MSVYRCLYDAVLEALDYFEQREDISGETNDDGSPRPNEAMQMASMLRSALKEARAIARAELEQMK
jgi:hypothetical protein